ncbi:uncharacterized membrane protein (DUF4010 family) [Paraburkholderia bannensis]|uniref:Uncharacterized membrane protein (DUF4010 family) n=1 Tax=Paraburkholderia bannensis TaxID=765414 RepID=A0A7W9U6K4_9BURK|nr:MULTISPECIES: DUF4010 domain-containing protein [Paraburkholderia]MBB3261920.1 uncharacterized membrane protein (DUF4010 family) [Paraburkholderia sp. WP4_3_2]MBB6106915.1 uncharacterized membrane protein (DUF4010 family) [Paraburkholderia bannensis]
MNSPSAEYMPFAVALGIGLLVGAERERRKGTGVTRAAAGIRTFVVIAVVGAISMRLGGTLLTVASTLALSALSTAAYLRPSDDPGLTTESAMIATLLLGGLAVADATLAAALGVILTIVLAARSQLHDFVTSRLGREEVFDLLTLAASALVILPMLPDRAVDIFGAINPQTVWRFAVLVMLISTMGHISQVALGPRIGLAFAGLLGGFVSSVATIAAMGRRAKASPATPLPMAAAAALSSLATLTQLCAVVGVVFKPLLLPLGPSLAAGTIASLVFGLVVTWFASRSPAHEAMVVGRAVDIKAALILAATLMILTLTSVLLTRWLGNAGIAITAAIGGLADAHSTAASVASLAAQSLITPKEAVLPVLVTVTSNALTKCAVAIFLGTRAFAVIVISGQLFIVAAVWAVWAIEH